MIVVDEGRLLAKVRHRGVVTVYGAAREAGFAGLWMELIQGATLRGDRPAAGALQRARGGAVRRRGVRGARRRALGRPAPSRRQGAERDARLQRPRGADGFRHRPPARAARRGRRRRSRRHAALHGAGAVLRRRRGARRPTSTASACCCSASSPAASRCRPARSPKSASATNRTGPSGSATSAPICRRGSSPSSSARCPAIRPAATPAPASWSWR